MAGIGSKTPWAWALAALALGGCGSADGNAGPRPTPSPLKVKAAITDERVAVSPRRFGAGPIVLKVSNRTRAPRSITFETDERAGSSPGVRQTTSPINPASTATLMLDVRQGIYRLSADGGRAAAASIRVVPPGPSAQGAMLVP